MDRTNWSIVTFKSLASRVSIFEEVSTWTATALELPAAAETACTLLATESTLCEASVTFLAISLVAAPCSSTAAAIPVAAVDVSPVV
jgi:hypothetical protein